MGERADNARFGAAAEACRAYDLPVIVNRLSASHDQPKNIAYTTTRENWPTTEFRITRQGSTK